jgi:hypothetical protein
MPVQEGGKPVRVSEDLAVDPGVARMLSQFVGCRRAAQVMRG